MDTVATIPTGAMAERWKWTSFVIWGLFCGAIYYPLFGAWTCGACLGSVGMALHHKICHTLGGSFHLPHAQTHTVILPHATAYNERAVSAELQPVAELLGAARASEGLWTLAKSLGAPMTLSSWASRRRTSIARSRSMENAYWNPQPVVAHELRRLLENAFRGRPPGTAF
jgi:alcohol dehydrogenase class IV